MPNTTVNSYAQRDSTDRYITPSGRTTSTGRTKTHVKNIHGIMNHCQVGDADDPSPDTSSCCFMNPCCAAAVQLADLHKRTPLKIRSLPTEWITCSMYVAQYDISKWTAYLYIIFSSTY